jgi:hypothetical protein
MHKYLMLLKIGVTNRSDFIDRYPDDYALKAWKMEREDDRSTFGLCFLFSDSCDTGDSRRCHEQ